VRELDAALCGRRRRIGMRGRRSAAWPRRAA